MTITWQNDPLLLDPLSTPIENWLSANELIERGDYSKIFMHSTELLQLYSILVKKLEFQRTSKTDRILTRFPYLILTENEQALIEQKSLRIAECLRHYFFRSVNDKILVWRKRLDHYLEQGAMPFPLVRCAWEIIGPTIKTNQRSFQSPKGKQYRIPLKLTPKLAYLCGVINGDGHLHRHCLRIVDETKEHINQLSNLFRELFADPGEVFPTSSKNAWNLELHSSPVVYLFHFLTGQSIGSEKYSSLREPLLFKLLGNDFRRRYWAGVMDADGSFKTNLSFTSSSKLFITDFRNCLKSLGIHSKLSRISDIGYYLYIPTKYRLRFLQEIQPIRNPKKYKDLRDIYQKIKNYFYGLNPRTLLNGIYFDLMKMPSLYIQGIHEYLLSLRGGTTISHWSRTLGISSSKYRYYEQGRRAVPLSILQHIFSMTGQSLENLYTTLLQHYNQIFFTSSISHPIKLPLKVTPTVVTLMSILQPLTNYAKVLYPTSELIQQLEDLFYVKITNDRLCNKVVVNFLTTFGIYEKPSLKELTE